MILADLLIVCGQKSFIRGRISEELAYYIDKALCFLATSSVLTTDNVFFSPRDAILYAHLYPVPVLCTVSKLTCSHQTSWQTSYFPAAAMQFSESLLRWREMDDTIISTNTQF